VATILKLYIIKQCLTMSLCFADVIMARVESKAQLDQFVHAFELHTRTAYSIQSSKPGSAECGFVDYHCIYAGCAQWKAKPDRPRKETQKERSSRKTGCSSRMMVHVPKSRWPEFNWTVGTYCTTVVAWGERGGLLPSLRQG
jgi:hypothetical protein